MVQQGYQISDRDYWRPDDNLRKKWGLTPQISPPRKFSFRIAALTEALTKVQHAYSVIKSALRDIR